MATLTDRQIAAAAQSAGFSGRDLTIAVAIALAESGGNASATHRNSNGSTDYGLFQINSIHGALLASGSWSNPTDNARMARKVFADAGNRWRPWSTYNSGRYLAYYGRASAAAGSPDNSLPSAPGTGTVTAGNGDLQGLVNFAQAISDPNTWARIAYFVIGTIMCIWGLMKMTGDNKLSQTTKTVLKTAAEVAAVPK